MRSVLAAAAVTVVTALVVSAPPVAADHTDQIDPSDTDGRLDVEAVGFDHSDTAAVWRLRTFRAWTIREIRDRGFVFVELDTLGGAAIDHLVVVRSDGRRLLAALFRLRRDGRQVRVGALGVDKVGPRTALVELPLRKVEVGSNKTSYFWAAVTSYTGSACPRTCLDRIPDVGTIEQPLPGATPTPSPSPSP